MKITSKAVAIISSIVVVVSAGLIYYLDSRDSGEVLGWMSSSWLYRRGIEVNNSSGGDLLNEDVLIEIDTATLISAGKMQSDCDDLRFTDSDTTTAINYWIESGCNTTTTQVWVRIPELLSTGKTIYFYYGNPSATNSELRWPIYLSFGDGADGNATVSSNININTGSAVGRACADAINYNISSFGGTTTTTAILTPTPATGCLSPGDEVLLINLQGIPSAFSNVGNHEIMVIDSITENTVTFTTAKTLYYGDGTSNDSNLGTSTSNQRVMLQRVPNYANVTINTGYTFFPSAWNGQKGGVLAFKSSGTTTINGSIDVDYLGYRGGNGGLYYANAGESISGEDGGGDGGRGTPVTAAVAGTAGGGGGGTNTSTSGASGSASQGGAGGGGGAIYTTDTNNDRRYWGGGGGGGGYGSAAKGGNQPYKGGSADIAVGGDGGVNSSGNGGDYVVTSSYTRISGAGGGGGSYGSTTLEKIFLGSGGGAGGSGKQGGSSHKVGGNGGNGAGIVAIKAKTFNSSSGDISVNAQHGSGTYTSYYYGGGGGGGSGGSVKIISSSLTVGDRRITTLFGYGFNNYNNNDGGHGGDGRTYLGYIDSVSGNSNPDATIEQLPLQSSIILDEETGNETPTTPTSLYTEGSTNPSGVSDVTPEFSAVYNDPDTDDTSTYYEIEVNTNLTFTGTVMWDSGKTLMIMVNQGNRSSDISYAGTTLAQDGTTYYWRIKFWDSKDAESPWSATANFTMNNQPNAPESLLTEGQENPEKTSLTPYFSATFSDDDVSDTATHYQLLINTESDFTGTTMWDSTKTAFGTPITNGTRSSNITYAGSTLDSGTTYYWKIKFWDENDIEGPYSETANYLTGNPPSMPTSLRIDGKTNPNYLTSSTPPFSAVYSDINGDSSSAYEINVNSNTLFTGSVIWNTGKQSITILNGQRSQDITYNGSPLINSKNIYYWRIRFWDTDNTVGEWSETAYFTDSTVQELKMEGLSLEGINID